MIVDRVERAAADQRLDRAPVDDALVDALAEIEQVLERTASSRAATIASIADSPVPLIDASP